MPKSSKIIHLRISVGADDPRSMEDFKKDVLKALTKAKPKNVTSMGEEHLHEGQRYSVPQWEEFAAATEIPQETEGAADAS